MNIFIICQWFPPEHAPIGVMLKELSQDLTDLGHSVTVITGFPNHPNGIVYQGYKKKLFLQETVEGVNLIRCYLFTSPDKSFFKRVMNFLTFAVTSFLAALTLPNQHIQFVVSPPITNGLVAIILKKLKGIKLVFNIQDIYPDVAITTGVIQNPVLIKLLKRYEQIIYDQADQITVISHGFEKNLLSKGVIKNKITVIPNWIDTNEVYPRERDNSFARKHGLIDKFVVLYSGTIGLISGAEVLVECAAMLQSYKDIVFLFVGEGIVKDNIQHAATARDLTNMYFLPFQPREFLSDVQSTADVSVVTLKKGKGKTSVPSKVLGFMAAARPVIASVDADSDTAQLIKNANCGFCVEAESAECIKSAVLYFYNDRFSGRTLGANGRIYLESHFHRNKVTSCYERALKDTLAEKKL
ncbi:glycosyltransferase family 4 protein [Sporomusa aerivorans]|uniref:glycosyltransferase family 4 protein n=1 Tax=Sporomusa aerivorans TaxID=204936 RepID=UPI00352B40BD